MYLTLTIISPPKVVTQLPKPNKDLSEFIIEKTSLHACNSLFKNLATRCCHSNRLLPTNAILKETLSSIVPKIVAIVDCFVELYYTS
jgi:hypothetical protein